MVAQDTLDHYRDWLAYRRWFLRIPGVQDVALLDGRLFALTPMVANPADDPVALEVSTTAP